MGESQRISRRRHIILCCCHDYFPICFAPFIDMYIQWFYISAYTWYVNASTYMRMLICMLFQTAFRCHDNMYVPGTIVRMDVSHVPMMYIYVHISLLMLFVAYCCLRLLRIITTGAGIRQAPWHCLI